MKCIKRIRREPLGLVLLLRLVICATCRVLRSWPQFLKYIFTWGLQFFTTNAIWNKSLKTDFSVFLIFPIWAGLRLESKLAPKKWVEKLWIQGRQKHCIDFLRIMMISADDSWCQLVTIDTIFWKNCPTLQGADLCRMARKWSWIGDICIDGEILGQCPHNYH